MINKVQTAKLIDIAQLNPRPTKNLKGDELVSFLGMASVTAETASTTKGEEKLYEEVSKGYTPFINGDILLAKITPCFENGKIAQANLQHPIGFGSTEFHVIRPKPDQSDVRYLLHYLRQQHIRLDGARKMTGSAGQRRVPEHFLTSLEIPLPPIAEQKRIAEILDRTQSLISKRKEAIAKLDTLTQSIFLEMFGDPVENNRDWSKLNFAEISPEKGLIVDGPFGSTLKPDSYVETGVRVIRNFNINDASFDGSKFVYITRNKFNEIYRSHVCTNDILISTKGTIGDVCLMPDLSGDSVLSASGTVRIRLPVNSPLLPYFVVYQMIQPHYKQYIKSFEAGSNQKYLNLSQIRKMELIVPPLPLQQEFAQRVEAVEKLKATHHASLSQLEALFASLQHRAFRGEL
jgi:type I restriction enzyme S subunit